MRVNLELNDGRQVQTGSRMRYCCFRLTHNNGFAVKHDQQAEPLVKWARDKWGREGFHYMVVDTVSGEAIAFYPCIERNWIRGHAPPMRPCPECNGGWTKVPGSDAYVPDHALDCSEFE